MTLQSIIEDLEVIADWRDNLQSRLHCAQLKFEYVGLDADEQNALAAEVQEFTQVCRGLSGQQPSTAERRAA